MRKDMASLAVLTALELLLTLYLILLNMKSSSVVELWPLEGILTETIIMVSSIVVMAWLIFRKTMPASLFASIILLSLLIAIPIVKYPNDELLYGLYDPTAFYSFTKWIVDNGHIASNNELYYSNQYGNHPGIAVIPAVIQIVTGLNAPLTVAMYITLAVVYSIYIFFLLCTLKFINLSQSDGYFNYLLLLSIIIFLMFFNSYYGGVEIGYSFVGMSLYIAISMLIRPRERPVSKPIVLGTLAYIGLLLTHYSTAVIMAFYFIVLFVGSLIVLGRQHVRILASVSLLIIAIFFSYELYVDVYLSSSTIHGAFNILSSLYIMELETASKVLEVHATLTYSDILKYLISRYAKYIVTLASILIYILVVAFEWRSFTKMHKLLASLLMLSLSTWIVGWAGVGSFMSGGRALPLIQFMLVLNIAYYFSKNLRRLTIKRRHFLLNFTALFLIVTGFIFNYGIPVAPSIQAEEGDVYTYPAGGQVAITMWSLHPIEFADNFLNQYGPRFLCLQPFTSFGLCDLLWNKPKIPIHGFISPQATASKEVIKLIDSYTNVVVPVPSSDKVLPGPIGYASFYLTPYYYCVNYCEGKIYTNGFYHLFIR